MKNPREFWLVKDNTPHGEWTTGAKWYDSKMYSNENDPRQIHVIEKSAYDKAVYALKYYADYEPCFSADCDTGIAIDILKELGEL